MYPKVLNKCVYLPLNFVLIRLSQFTLFKYFLLKKITP